MKRALHLLVAALLVAACANWQQDSPAPGVSGLATSAVTVPNGSGSAPGLSAWAPYRAFNFASETVDISPEDTPKLREIVVHLQSDSSLDIAVVGIPGSEEASQADRNLSRRRAASVRQALMDAGGGVASYKIQMGPFAETIGPRAGQILVWVRPRMRAPKPSL